MTSVATGMLWEAGSWKLGWGSRTMYGLVWDSIDDGFCDGVGGRLEVRGVL